MREVTIGVLLLGAVVLVGRAEQTGSLNADKPTVFDTFTPGPCSPNGQRHGGCPQGSRVRIRVVSVATGFVHPWHIAFLPDGVTILVTELPGRLRMIRNGTLDAQPISGWPPENLQARGLNSVLVHPQFAQNHYVYLSYPKAREPGAGMPTTLALARGRLEGTTLTDVRDIFVTDSWQVGGALAGRAAFGPDGMIYLAAGDRDNRVLTDDGSARMSAQDLNSYVGKVLRLRDDGGVPADNPFVGRPGVKPEIYTYGHRNVYGFAWQPDSGALWACEIGPMGGDELNVLLPGRNYGWPLVSLGKIYTGKLSNDQSWYRPGMEMPVLYWMPAISPSSMIIYTGDRFPLWKGHFFIGALSGQQLQRIAFNQPPPQSERRESMLTLLDLRIRDVRQGLDGLIYIATEQPGETTAQAPIGGTDNPTGSILRIEPAE
jgi:aldose sugar dehydrogenase